MIPALLIAAAAMLLTLTMGIVLLARLKETGDALGLLVFFLVILNIGVAGFTVYSAFHGAAMVRDAVSQADSGLGALIEQQRRLLDAQSLPAPEAVAPTGDYASE